MKNDFFGYYYKLLNLKINLNPISTIGYLNGFEILILLLDFKVDLYQNFIK